MSPEPPLVSLLRTDAPPVELAALLVAQDARRSLNVEAELRVIDELAAPVRGLGARSASAEEAAVALASHIHGTLGFRGNHEDYYDPNNTYLDQVIDRRLGIPISLSVVYLAIGQRAGVPMEGIGFPGHFFVRVGGPSGVYQDPFHAGRLLDASLLDELGRRFLGGRTIDPGHLHPVDSRAMAIRMLANLQVAHARRGDHASGLLVCDRLVEITGEPSRRRDRGMHELALRAYEAAAEDLSAYLEAVPGAPDREKVAAAIRLARSGGGHSLN